jgi:NADH-quinone oxidoreductase subunit H
MEIFYYLMFFKAIAIIVPLLIAVAYFTLLERKIMASIQRRKGPNVVGYLGLLQPLADGLKLFVKETIIPSNSNFFIFLLAPVITFTLSLLGWAVIPFNIGLVASNINVGLLYLLTISSLSVYGILLAGWSSNSKYAFLGALRSISQMISYEISISFILLTVILSSGSLNLTEIVVSQQKIWYIFILFPSFLMFFVSALAETNRHPFDLPEAEAELVSGYNVEYSGMAFALFFLGEYANMLLMSALTTILFFGGWLPFTTFTLFAYIPAFIWFGGKLLIFVILFCVIRAAVPRYRYDQLMSIGWKTFLPISISWFLFISAMVYSFNTSLFGVSYLMYF